MFSPFFLLLLLSFVVVVVVVVVVVIFLLLLVWRDVPSSPFPVPPLCAAAVLFSRTRAAPDQVLNVRSLVEEVESWEEFFGAERAVQAERRCSGEEVLLLLF